MYRPDSVKMGCPKCGGCGRESPDDKPVWWVDVREVDDSTEGAGEAIRRILDYVTKKEALVAYEAMLHEIWARRAKGMYEPK